MMGMIESRRAGVGKGATSRPKLVALYIPTTTQGQRRKQRLQTDQAGSGQGVNLDGGYRSTFNARARLRLLRQQARLTLQGAQGRAKFKKIA